MRCNPAAHATPRRAAAIATTMTQSAAADAKSDEPAPEARQAPQTPAAGEPQPSQPGPAPASTARPARSLLLDSRGLFILAATVFSYLFVVNAWVVDDAYITFRTVNNFIHGHGLTWNPPERVQVYTHPLWMFVMSVLYFVTREPFYTCLALSLGLGIFMLWLARRALAEHPPWVFALFFLFLASSKSFVDFTSSGLENPLSHALVLLFYVRFLEARRDWRRASERDLTVLFLIGALAFFNREDTVILYLPPLVYVLAVNVRRLRWRLARLVAIGTLPATLWLLFSVVYYGYPFPNTAYAKSLATGANTAKYWNQGVTYLLTTVVWDPPTLLFMAAALALTAAAWRKTWRNDALAGAGIGLYLIYILRVGAAGSNMSGRFLSTPYLLAAFVLVRRVVELPDRLTTLALAGLAALFFLLAPASPLKAGTSAYQAPGDGGRGRSFIIDTRFLVQKEGASLIDFSRGGTMPDHAWYKKGVKFRAGAARVNVGGANGTGAIGYFGFAVGPDKYIIDPLGLGDPLLSRLPIADPNAWDPGHFSRAVPKGYKESIEQGRNLIEDPSLHEYYDRIRTITRGPIFSWQRLKTIVGMNVGSYDHLVDEYHQREKAAVPVKP